MFTHLQTAVTLDSSVVCDGRPARRRVENRKHFFSHSLRNGSLYTIAYTKSHTTELPFTEIQVPLPAFTQLASDLRVYQCGGNAEKMSSYCYMNIISSTRVRFLGHASFDKTSAFSVIHNTHMNLHRCSKVNKKVNQSHYRPEVPRE